MSFPSDDRELERWLARELKQSAEYIDDNGFTDRVMSSLPVEPAPRRLPFWLGSLLVALLLGMGAVLIVPVQPLMVQLTSMLLATPLIAWLQVGLGLSLLVVTGAGYWVWREVSS